METESCGETLESMNATDCCRNGITDQGTDDSDRPIATDVYLTIVVHPGGHVQIRGEPEDVRGFLKACAGSGILFSLDYLSRCG